MMVKGINLREKFSLFNELWSPKCIARIDNYIIKIAKIKDDFSWHTHKDCDEVFIVHEGSMRIDLKGSSVELSKGEMFVVEKGLEHKPHADKVCEIIMFEREDVINTGNDVNEFTKDELDWI